MFVHAIFAHFGRQNRLLGQNATGREKRRDWLAVDAVESELFSAKFPANREIYREYWASIRSLRRVSPCPRVPWEKTLAF
jgi:hypothetical protein